ncbi:unnamed protein product [Effrenium voratum]|uniref:Uncharacterized protein n=1 Tax=Effrenium voratum TaxID=2562239 RepID=A0AA36JB27_9DINO|nr:unnamed protein product [Effrenium voratum]
MRDPLRCSTNGMEDGYTQAWNISPVVQVLLDAGLSTATILFVYLLSSWNSTELYCVLAISLLLAMIGWRLWRVRTNQTQAGVPYTCGHAVANGKEVFIVSTLHVSPRSERDVIATIGAVRPDAVMIELDEERLEFMRGPSRPTLQAFQYTSGDSTVSLWAQRAHWNGEYAGESVTGPIVLDEGQELPPGCLALSRPDAAPLALRAFQAAQRGARAVLLQGERLPAGRLGTETLLTELRVAMEVRNSGFPPIPALLLPSSELMDLLQTSEVQGSFQVLADTFPRRTPRRRLCQEFAFALSGIWLLYGIIECFKVDAGDEFLAAEREALRLGVPCCCVDLDTDRLCSRFAATAAPWPRNLLRALLAWLSAPRCVFRVCFPKRSDLDVLGSSLLHFASFRIGIWLSFLLAATCAGCLVAGLLLLLSSGAEGAAEGAGVVKPEDRQAVLSDILLAIEMYLIPCVYSAIVASRDEAMYVSMASQVQSRSACQRVVLVVGAAHANGILQLIRARGL